MDQAAVLDGLYFDLLPFCQDCRAAAKVDVGGCQIAEAFVISAMVVMLDDANDLELLGCWVSHSRSPPAPLMFF